ncbi:MAG: GNAT family N-acetyltransferase [Sandaracinaceae bacterium]|nr:GNAT family N-acetyltransferase [Sandaracinaceae bacterium]
MSRIVQDLARAGVASELNCSDPGERARWSEWDLASMVEGCFDARAAAADRDAWLARLGESYGAPRFDDDDWLTRWLWLEDGRAHGGTLALPVSTFGRRRLPLFSLYVEPSRRGRGLATRALEATYRAAVAHGLGGVQLETHWAWKRSLRFYLERRMWVVGWASAIALAWDVTWPRWELREEPGRLALEAGGRRWIEARAEGSRLVLEEPAQTDEFDLARHAHATMAVVLALRGWPLVRSDSHWEDRFRHLELGAVEGLAERLDRLERSYLERGWEVRSPPSLRGG